MILTSASGDWIPAAGGIQCPHDRDLFVEAVLLTRGCPLVLEEDGRHRRVRGGVPRDRRALSPDGGLYVILRAFRDPGSVAGDQPIPVVRSAVWTHSEGWMEVVNDLAVPKDTVLRGLGGPTLGVGLYALVLDGTPPPGVAEWLSGILSDPAGIVLSLEVMES